MSTLAIMLAPLTLTAAAAVQPVPIDGAPTSANAEAANVTAEAAAEATADIVVEAGRRRAHEYRRKLGRASFQGQLPRWADPMCLRVVGLEDSVAERAFSERIYAVARSVGAPTAQKRCNTNVIVAWTGDGADLAQRLYRKRPTMLTDTTYDVKQRFLNAPLPVRWIPRAYYYAPDGATAGSGGEAGIAIAGSAGAGIDALTVRGSGASLINQQVAVELRSVTVIIDAERAAGVSLNALADHVAMLALTGVPMGGREGQLRGDESVLTLFEGDAGASDVTLTSADRNYLAALYGARPDRLARWHRGRITAAVEAGLVADGLAEDVADQRD